jgi:uridylate kinase
MDTPKYKRVLLKVSGEALAGPEGFGLDTATLNYVAQEIKSVHDKGVEVAVVVGGGNFIRGDAFSQKGALDRSTADQMGMMGTVINGLALQAAIEKTGLPVRVQSAITVAQVAESFIVRRARRHLEKGRVVVFAAGTGNPFFTTDTAGVLRALEIQADVLMKATKVDGIYDRDPNKFPDAVKYEKLGYNEAIQKRLAVMDQTAFTMCQEHKMSLIVLDLNQKDSMVKAVMGENIGTLVTGDTI